MLTLICGMPRAGKTTLSREYANVIHLDDTHSHRRVLAKMEGMEGDVCVEGVYLDPRQRAELRAAYAGRARCICLDTPREVREQRLGHAIRHELPFRLPTHDEGWDEIEVIR